MPTRGEGEERDDFIDRCVPEVIDEGKDPNQAVAICNSLADQKDNSCGCNEGCETCKNETPNKNSHEIDSLPLTDKQLALILTLEGITEETGQFNQGVLGDGAHYIGPGKNVFDEQGLNCENCVFFQPPNSCQIVGGEIFEQGVCKFWVIPEERIKSGDLMADNSEDKLAHNVKQHTISVNFENTRIERMDGREFIVGPVVMIKEGILNGILYTADELRKFPAAWDGSPIPVGHPTIDGRAVPANTPEVHQDLVIGQVFHTFFDETVRGLVAEFWIDIEKANELAPAILKKLKNGELFEVSTGLFTEDDMIGGEFNGESFTGTASNFRPDHVAILPDEVGACSNEDGCGFPRVNEKKFSVLDWVKKKLHTITHINQLSNREVAQSIQKDLDSRDTNIRLHFLREVFDDFFIFSVGNTETGEERLFRQSFDKDADRVDIKGSPVEVIERTTFQPADGEEINANEQEEGIMDEKVDALIANESNDFGEDDRERLSALGEDILDMMMSPVVDEASEAGEEDPAEEPENNKKQEEPMDVKAEIAAEVAKQVEDIQANAEKASVVKNILSHKENDLSEEDLNNLSIEGLRKMEAKLDPADYSGRGSASPRMNAGEDGIPEMPAIDWAN